MHVLSDTHKTSQQNISTRMRNAVRHTIDGAQVMLSGGKGDSYILLRVNGVTLYSYFIVPDSYSTQMYKGGFETPREFLFDNSPEKSSNKRLSHKRMFEKLLEHWHLERLQNQ